MEHASDVLSPRPVQTPQELNLEKLAKRKTKKTRLSFKQGTAEHKQVLDQVIKCVWGCGASPSAPCGDAPWP